MLVKVWNDNTLPFEQEFQGEKLKVAAQRYIMMDNEKAIMFRGQYFPMQFDAGGTQKRESYKMIRIEQMGGGELPKIDKLKCQACSYIGLNNADLDEHVNSEHLDQLINKEEYKKRAKKK